MSESTSSPAEATEPSFGEALAELETILERIDSDAVDVDVLANELRRATALLETCRGKIRQAEQEVGQIVQQLDET
ncbi:MAG: exodeoxyribonuclease VII small subunit [Acidobacteriota bacterium]